MTHHVDAGDEASGEMPPTDDARLDAFAADATQSIAEMLRSAPPDREDTVAWTPSPAPVAPPTRGWGSGGPSRRRTTLITVSAVVAVALVVGGVLLVSTRLAASSDGADEAARFAASEEALGAAQRGARTAHARVTTAIARADTDVAAAESVLSALSGYVDEAVLAEARAAASAFRTAAQASSPAPIDEFAAASNPGGGDAVALVQAQTSVATALAADLEDTLRRLETREETFRSAIHAVGDALPAAAAEAVASAPDADTALAASVTAVATSVTEAQDAGGLGIDEMQAFPPAVDALRADQALGARNADSEQRPTTPQRRPGSGVTPVTPADPAPPAEPEPAAPDPATPSPSEPGPDDSGGTSP